jgi:hypothetical protein
MALQPKLKIIGIAEDASSIVVKEFAGVYDASTNAGGYGAPNQNSGAIATAVLRINYLSDSLYYSANIPIPANLFTDAGVKITADMFGAMTPTKVFKDGVYDINYYVGFAGSNITFVANSKTFLLTNANTLFATAVGFIIPSVSASKIYFIDRLQTLSSTGGSVTEALPAITSAAIQIVYAYNFKMLIKTAGRKSLITDISAWNFAGCPDTDSKEVMKRYKFKLAMEIQFVKGHYLDAHNAALYLQG